MKIGCSLVWRSVRRVCLGSATLVSCILVVSVAAAQHAAETPAGTHSPFIQALTIGLPIAAGIIGYFITYNINWRLEKRKAQLKLVSDQLQYLYGPLFALSSAGTRASAALLERQNLKKYFFEPARQRYSEDDIKLYRLWMSEVFMPTNIRIEKVITENAHLIEGAKMPVEFGDFLAHLANYKAVVKTWPDNPPKGEVDYDEATRKNTALIPYPSEFPKYVTEMFNELKERQEKLIGLVVDDGRELARQRPPVRRKKPGGVTRRITSVPQ